MTCLLVTYVCMFAELQTINLFRLFTLILTKRRQHGNLVHLLEVDWKISCSDAAHFQSRVSIHKLDLLLRCCRVQELMGGEQRETGRIPRTVECHLTSDLCDSCVPGDSVTVTGIVRVTNDGTNTHSLTWEDWSNNICINSYLCLHTQEQQITGGIRISVCSSSTSRPRQSVTLKVLKHVTWIQWSRCTFYNVFLLLHV